MPLDERSLVEIEEEQVEEEDWKDLEIMARLARPIETDEDI